MPALLLFGATGMGKTRIIHRFLRENDSHFDEVRGSTRLPVVALQMPLTPHERDFYEELLVTIEAVLPVGLSSTNLRQRVRILARQLEVRMLVVDEIHAMLSGTFLGTTHLFELSAFPGQRSAFTSCLRGYQRGQTSAYDRPTIGRSLRGARTGRLA